MSLWTSKRCSAKIWKCSDTKFLPEALPRAFFCAFTVGVLLSHEVARPYTFADVSGAEYAFAAHNTLGNSALCGGCLLPSSGQVSAASVNLAQKISECLSRSFDIARKGLLVQKRGGVRTTGIASCKTGAFTKKLRLTCRSFFECSEGVFAHECSCIFAVQRCKFARMYRKTSYVCVFA